MKTEPEQPSNKDLIIKILSEKSIVKQKVYDNTFETFVMLKEVLHEMINEISDSVSSSDRRIKLDYRDRGRFEAEAKIAEDMLIFSMHSNVFEFDGEHSIRKMSYVEKEPLNSYCGIISIYNFLADSFKYNRTDDLGYLIGRIFVNREMRFFVEGMRFINDFGTKTIDRNELRAILETTVKYALEFDLFVPPYDMVKIASVYQLNQKIENAKLQTGKRLGFPFDSDDVLNV